jgi:hypothetical protein
MQVKCFDENRCVLCPLWSVEEEHRDEIADQIDNVIIGKGYGRDGRKPDPAEAAELCVAEARINGSPGDAGILLGALILKDTGFCTEPWSEG